MAFAEGKWHLVDSDNFDAYMQAVGVGLVTRKMAGALKPSQEVKVEGDKWEIKTSSTFKSSELKFTVGTTFDENTPDGRKCKTTASLDGQKLTLEQKGDVDSTIVRDYNGSDMLMTLTAKDVTCTRKYKKEE
ncbi:sodium/calcium exchanger regulatory protein 1-like [Haliotis cracherodii]|uniref:sodium/calcium exchanger regulatory protein 1-like n=1 Tax=Haliotis rufescens TaxID=6454 RepID=UPI001EB05EA1|nr:sodium/calcium exchanger regulatory protein 1-like [Haliotis rufescens]